MNVFFLLTRITLSDDEKDIRFTIRVSKDLLEAFDKKGSGARKDKICALMQREIQQPRGQVKVDYEKLKKDADDCRREMDRLKKAMGQKFYAIESLAQSFAPLTSDNYTIILQALWSYETGQEDNFNRNNIEDYIEYLEQMQKNEGILTDINAYRKTLCQEMDPSKVKSKQTSAKEKQKKRYIDPKDLCPCGSYETMEEHNIRCYKNIEELRNKSKNANPKNNSEASFVPSQEQHQPEEDEEP